MAGDEMVVPHAPAANLAELPCDPAVLRSDAFPESARGPLPPAASIAAFCESLCRIALERSELLAETRLWLVPTFAAAVADGDMPAALSRLLEVAQARREAALGGSCETGRRDYDEYWSDWRRGDCCVACCLKVCCWGPGPAFVAFLRCLIIYGTEPCR